MSNVKLPRTGDHVLHKPSGETWVVAYVEDDGRYLAACGWPFSLEPIASFTIEKVVSDEESEKLLQQLAAMHDMDDFRGRYARRVIRERAAKT